jgi:soluble lytic murein transglycosylase-like protein
MIRTICLASILVTLVSASAASAQDRVAGVDANGNLDSLIARHAAANNLPESMVRRIIKRESGGRAHVISKGNYGIMQIRLGTARAMGYRGTAAGLLDADTNMTYAVKYLAGAYHTAGGNPERTVRYYAAGYYYAAKGKGLFDKSGNGTFASNDNPLDAFANAVPRKTVTASAEPARRHTHEAPLQSAASVGPGSMDFR